MNPLSLLLAHLLLLAPIVDGWLGVYLDPDQERPVVVEVIPGSPAASAGLQAGDELLAVDDQATATREALVATIRAHKAGEDLRIRVRRSGKESVVTVRLAERPDEAPTPAPTPVSPKPERPSQPAGEAAPAVPAPSARKPYLGLRVRQTDRGVEVEEAIDGGPAAALGIRTGERITRLGERSIGSLADLDAVLSQSRPGGKLPIGLQSDHGARSVTLTLGSLPGGTEQPPAPRSQAKRPADEGYDIEREIEELRRDLRQLRQQLEELRQTPAPKGRE